MSLVIIYLLAIIPLAVRKVSFQQLHKLTVKKVIKIQK